MYALLCAHFVKYVCSMKLLQFYILATAFIQDFYNLKLKKMRKNTFFLLAGNMVVEEILESMGDFSAKEFSIKSRSWELDGVSLPCLEENMSLHSCAGSLNV